MPNFLPTLRQIRNFHLIKLTIMKTIYLTLLLFVSGLVTVQAQSADEIIDAYHEVIGGKEKLKAIKGIKMSGKVNQGGLEIPVDVYQMADGKTMTVINFQGMTIYQGVFDGETLWGTNFQTMQAEKSDAEATENLKRNAMDFPDAFMDYASKGYTVELVGQETFEGTDAHKIKLTKSPMLVDGEEVANISFYFFDTETGVLLGTEAEAKSGPMAGQVSMTVVTDYDEVDGLYFPFTMSTGIKGGAMQAISFESIELNPEVEASAFTFPAGN